MDVGTATSTAAYSYQATLQASGQSAAVLQALANAYSNSSASAQDSADPLASLAGASSVGSLVSGITTLTQAASGSKSTAISGLQDATFGGLDTSAAASLMASVTDSSGTSGLQGFDTGVSTQASLAIAAYQAQQTYSVPAPAAQSSPSSTPSSTVSDSTATTPAAVPQASGTASTSQDPNSNAAIQQAVAAAISPSVLSLLA